MEVENENKKSIERILEILYEEHQEKNEKNISQTIEDFEDFKKESFVCFLQKNSSIGDLCNDSYYNVIIKTLKKASIQQNPISLEEACNILFDITRDEIFALNLLIIAEGNETHKSLNLMRKKTGYPTGWFCAAIYNWFISNPRVKSIIKDDLGIIYPSLFYDEDKEKYYNPMSRALKN